MVKWFISGYGLPSSLNINGLTSSTTYYVSVYALNGNGYTGNYGSAGTGSQATNAAPNVTLSVSSDSGSEAVQPALP
jgi:hypothetical protein